MSVRASRRAPFAVAGVAAAILVAGCGSDADAAVGEPLLVAAAADLRPAFGELGDSFEDATGIEVVFSFGSSGQLAQQLIEGAPMDLYASANAAYVDLVLDAGVGDRDTRTTYAYGRIAMWSDAQVWGGWDGLEDIATDGTITNIAIANPEHAPYGQAAREAFESAGVWEAVTDRLVYGENIADTQRLAATGNADVAVVALSLAIASDEAGTEGGPWRWELVDDDLHAPLQQDLVVVTDDAERRAAAERFLDHVASDEGREVMRRLGFLLPGDTPPDAWGD